MLTFDPAFGPLIADASGAYFNPEYDTVLGRLEGGKLLGGIIFTEYTGASINIHCAGVHPTWLSRDLLWATFHYCFVRLGCKTVLSKVPDNNVRALEFNYKLGFIKVAHIDDVFDDAGLCILKMRREDCRWLQLRPRRLKEPIHGVLQKEESTATS